MSNPFIYLLIFASVILLIYYVVIIYFDLMKEKKENEDNEVFIPGGDDTVTVESKTVNAEGVIVENNNETEDSSNIPEFDPLGFSPSQPENEEEREEEHNFINDSNEQEQSSEEKNDEVSPVEDNNVPEEKGNDIPEESEYKNDEEVTEEDREREYWRDPFAFEPSEESEEASGEFEGENVESEESDGSQNDYLQLYDASNVNLEKDQTECNEINDSLEPADKYYPGEMDIEAFAKNVMEENAPEDISENFMERM